MADCIFHTFCVCTVQSIFVNSEQGAGQSPGFHLHKSQYILSDQPPLA